MIKKIVVLTVFVLAFAVSAAASSILVEPPDEEVLPSPSSLPVTSIVPGYEDPVFTVSAETIDQGYGGVWSAVENTQDTLVGLTLMGIPSSLFQVITTAAEPWPEPPIYEFQPGNGQIIISNPVEPSTPLVMETPEPRMTIFLSFVLCVAVFYRAAARRFHLKVGRF